MIEVNGCYVYVGKDFTVKLENEKEAHEFALNLVTQLIKEGEVML